MFGEMSDNLQLYLSYFHKMSGWNYQQDRTWSKAKHQDEPKTRLLHIALTISQLAEREASHHDL